ncbi:MAG: hypothetical protein FGF50_11775 [Candidatus Brockarchaeota archaeon]|nr:hypothetical protein [Candidatus Brockarchaeota archaeon]
MNPELRKRLVDSIEYLRKMDFFKEYFNLASEEILEKIFSGEIDYESQWFVEEIKERRGKEYFEVWGKKSYGMTLKKSLEESEGYWLKRSDFEIDVEIACFEKWRRANGHPEA